MITASQMLRFYSKGRWCWLSIVALAFGMATARAQTPIEILQQPRDIFTLIYREATFHIVARAMTNGTVPAPLTYQWIEAGFLILGATNATWVRPPSFDCINTDYSCIIRSGEAYLFSDSARLRISTDCSPLRMVSVEGDAANQEIVVRFDEPVDTFSAMDVFNYLFYEDGRTNEFDGIYADYATMLDSATVVLHFGLEQSLRSDTRYVLHPSSEYLRDCCSNGSCDCGRLQDYLFGWPFITRSEYCAEISREPEAPVVQENCSATFEVKAGWLDGINRQPFRYQWYYNGIQLWGATNRTYTTWPLSRHGQATRYRVEIRGACEVLRSISVSPIVVTNATYIRLHAVRPGPAADSVVFNFTTVCGGPDIPLRITSAERLNFQWSGGLTTKSASFDCTGTNIIVFTSPQQPGGNYIVTVSNIQDWANYVLENGSATAGYTAPARPSEVPFGTLRATATGNQTLLEWADGGVLQVSNGPNGPWADIDRETSPSIVTASPYPCTAIHFPHWQRFYRVRWPAVP